MARLALSISQTVSRTLLILSVALTLMGCATYGPAHQGETIHRNVVYAQRGATKLHVDLYVPTNPHPAPLIVCIHGGSWKYGDKGFHFLFRNLTRDGFAVASF